MAGTNGAYEPAASTTQAGVVELATTSETTAGTDADRAVTPLGAATILATKAPVASPTFTGTVTAPLVKITSGVPGAGKVLTSDADGDATWETPAAGVTDHTLLSNIGTNAHSVIDTHLAAANPHSGLSAVNNTSDANKPVSTATQTALGLKAPIASPTFTGLVTAATVKITGGSPGLYKTLQSDADGDAVWGFSLDHVNVLEQGVVGDGVTDDTAAINAAIAAAAAYSTILFPGGRTYLVSGTVRLYGNHTYIMRGATIKQANGTNLTGPLVASNGWYTDPVSPPADAPIKIVGGTIDGNKANNTGTTDGLTLRAYWSSVSHMTVRNMTGEGFQPTDIGLNGRIIASTCVEMYFDRCEVRTCNGNAFHQIDSGSSQVTDGFIRDLIVQGIGQSSTTECGILLDKAAGWLVQGCHIYAVNGFGIKALKGFGTRIIVNYVEAFGRSTTAPTGGMAGIFLTSDTGYGNVIAGNNIELKAEDLVATGLYRGINVQTNTGHTALYAVTGNTCVLYNSVPIALAATCDPLRIINQAAATTSIYACAGNSDQGWSTTGLQTTATGTHTLQVSSGSQPLDTDLTAFAALVSAADKLPYATGAGTWALTDFTAAGRALAGGANAAAQRTTLGLVIGTNVQAWDADLDAIAALSTTAYGRALLTLADQAALTAAVAAASDTLSGAVELATSAEVITGTDTTRAVTPAGAAAARLRVSNPTLPTGAVWQCVDRQFITLGSSVTVSGRVQMGLHWLPAGLVITTLSFYTGSAGATTGPQNQWAFVADSSRVGLSYSADLTTTAWGNSAAQVFTMAASKSDATPTPYTIPTSGLYYVGIMSKSSGTSPTIITHNMGSTTIGGIAPIFCGTSDTGCSTVATAPSTFAALTSSTQQPWWVAA